MNSCHQEAIGATVLTRPRVASSSSSTCRPIGDSAAMSATQPHNKNDEIKSTNTKSNTKKNVRFASTIKGVLVAYPQHEHTARWRTKHDEVATHSELRETVSIMRLNQGTVPTQLEDANVATCRGLEHMVSKRVLKDSSRAKNRAIHAVLDEFDRHYMLNHHHRNSIAAQEDAALSIATISSVYTAHARSVAQLRGEADAAYVQKRVSGVDSSSRYAVTTVLKANTYVKTNKYV